MLEHLADEFEDPAPGPHDRARKFVAAAGVTGGVSAGARAAVLMLLNSHNLAGEANPEAMTSCKPGTRPFGLRCGRGYHRTSRHT